MSMHIKVEISDAELPAMLRQAVKDSRVNSLPRSKRAEFAKAMKEREEYGEEEDDDDGDEPPMGDSLPPSIPVTKSDLPKPVAKKVPPMPKGVKASKKGK